MAQSEVKDSLMFLMSQKNNCEYEFIFGQLYTGQGQDAPNVTINFVGNVELQMYSIRNKDEVIPVLIELLKTEEFDWVSNLLLYHLTKEDASHMRQYWRDKCEEWKKEQKSNSIKFWKNYLQR